MGQGGQKQARQRSGLPQSSPTFFSGLREKTRPDAPQTDRTALDLFHGPDSTVRIRERSNSKKILRSRKIYLGDA